jgi:hypothetical protein
METGSADLGGGELKSTALVFGTFSGEAKRPYTMEFQAGPGMTPVLSAKPRLEIVRVSPVR